LTSNIIPYEYPDVVASFLEDIGYITRTGDATGTPEERLEATLDALSNLFSLNVPTIGQDPMNVLRQIAIETKLSNIARERAFYKLYLMVRNTKEIDGMILPMWYGIADDQGKLLGTQEEFIGWFTSKSGLGRASTFRRIKVYQRLEEFGISGQDAWLKVLQMPTVMQKLTDIIAIWDRNKLIDIDSKIALGLTKELMPDRVRELEEAIQNDDNDRVREIYTPVIKKFFDEASTYQDAKVALDHVMLDLLLKPTISYKWIADEGAIGVTLRTPIIDENGEPLGDRVYETAIYIDDPEYPSELMADLVERLPLTNRHEYRY